MTTNNKRHRHILARIADQAMVERGLYPEFSQAAQAELSRLNAPSTETGDDIRDLTRLLWCSIDNDDSLDLDQLTTAEQMAGGRVRILVSVADVDALVKPDSAINAHAQHNTTSVYTAARVYSMLPEKLSTDLTSLNLESNRLSMVMDMIIEPDGSLAESSVYRARVHNKAKLAYNGVAAWLDGNPSQPASFASVVGLPENLRLQDLVAQRMRRLRHSHGALSLETIESKAVFEDDQLTALEPEERDRAKDIIENFMVAANGVTARYLAAHACPSIRRVVRVPKRWDRIVELASQHNFQLPPDPDSRALEEFLITQRETDPLRFPDLSLSVIKLMGSGEYLAERAETPAPGHFGLAVKDYAHSTAPNRRFPDLITQRLLKATLAGRTPPYDFEMLEALATHCTEAEDAAAKVERRVQKSAAALLLEPRVGEQFDAIVTGAAAKGTWVRMLTFPIEGKLVHGYHGVDVGDRIRVQLIEADVERGFIDFARIDHGHPD
jgi:ribonuclease R